MIDIYFEYWYNIVLVSKREARFMDVQVGDVLTMKKKHPCGAFEFDVLRSGMDFKLKCRGCGHEIMSPRSKAEKNIRKITRPEAKT